MVTPGAIVRFEKLPSVAPSKVTSEEVPKAPTAVAKFVAAAEEIGWELVVEDMMSSPEYVTTEADAVESDSARVNIVDESFCGSGIKKISPRYGFTMYTLSIG
jgi:hypothetical protein